MLSRLRRLLLRPLEGSVPRPADAVVVGALVVLPVAVAQLVWVYYVMTHPDSAPFVDRTHLQRLVFPIVAVTPVAYGCLLVAGLVARKRRPQSRLLAHAFAQVFTANLAFGAYLFGHYTSLNAGAVLFTGTVMGLLFFETRIVRAGLIVFLLLLAAATVAERMGAIPYAPFFLDPSYETGRPSGEFLVISASYYAILLAAAFIFVAAIQRLRRATDLIRRYVPDQLAETILAGKYSGATHPERRKVTLFFSDIVGFTEAADQMEAEDLSSLLNEYLSEMAAIADAFGATLNQFVGDGIMSFFGAPVATDDRDHALRAVRMALAMQRRMAELREKWFTDGIATPFRIRIGINTGVASVGDFGSKGRTTYSAIGNQTNLTARIQSHCEPGKVLISHTTWALVRDEISCEARGQIEVKGLHYPVLVYEVVQDT